MNLTCGRAYSGFRDCITNDPTGSDIFTVEIQYSVLSIQNLHSITQSLTWTTWKQLRSLRRFERSTIVLLSYWPNQGSFKVGGSKSIYTVPDTVAMWKKHLSRYPYLYRNATGKGIIATELSFWKLYIAYRITPDRYFFAPLRKAHVQQHISYVLEIVSECAVISKNLIHFLIGCSFLMFLRNSFHFSAAA